MKVRKKVLYAVQGTGNGHVARAREIIPLLQQYCDVDIFLGGNQSEVALPVTAKYHSSGLVMYYDKKGGVSYLKTLVKNNFLQIFRDIVKAPVRDYDLVINDFEFITAYACLIYRKKCFQLSHQAAFLSDKSPRPKKKSFIGEFILKYYAPSTDKIGFHFRRYDDFIFTPVIRSEVREIVPKLQKIVAVYLPAYHHDFIVSKIEEITDVHWIVFSKSAQVISSRNHIQIEPIQNNRFIDALAHSMGVICSAGFETPAEVLYLGKKLLVIPIKKQYEQLCNAAALEEMGVLVYQSLEELRPSHLRAWLNLESPVKIQEIHSAKHVLDLIFNSSKP